MKVVITRFRFFKVKAYQTIDCSLNDFFGDHSTRFTISDFAATSGRRRRADDKQKILKIVNC